MIGYDDLCEFVFAVMIVVRVLSLVKCISEYTSRATGRFFFFSLRILLDLKKKGGGDFFEK